jgi:hypothetical protein
LRKKLSERGLEFDTRSPHIELNHNKNRNLSEKALKLESIYINKNITLLNDKAIVVNTGYIEGYGMTHCTIAYFMNGLSSNMFNNILKWLI